MTPYNCSHYPHFPQCRIIAKRLRRRHSSTNTVTH